MTYADKQSDLIMSSLYIKRTNLYANFNFAI